MQKRIYAFTLGLLALFSLSVSLVRADGSFRIRLVSDPQTFDWNLATTPMETYLLMNIMEGLVEFDSRMKVKPALAKSWSVSKDQLTYTFKLRTDVPWSDGKILQAKDFVDSWRRLLSPLTGAAYAYILFDIEGAEEFNARKIDDFSKVGIKALDTTTIEIKLKKPVAYFVQLLTFWVTFPIRQDLIDANAVNWTKPGKMAVVGPFIPTSYSPGTMIVLKRNERYYGKKPSLDEVQLKIVNEDSTALNLFKAGQLDCVMPLNFLELGELVKTPAYHTSAYYRTAFLGFNVNKYPVNLPKVRQAIAMSIDKSKIGAVMHQSKTMANSLVDPLIFPEGKNVGLPFDPASAKKLLKEVGIDPLTSAPLELLTYSSDDNALLTQYLQAQVKKNLGFNIQISMPEYKTFRTQLDLQISAMQHRFWGADYADPDTYFGVFLSTSGNNRTGWKNARYDELVRKAAGLPDGAERVKAYKEALEILLRKEAAIVPLHFDTLSYVLNPKVKNFVINPLNYVYFRDIVFSP